MTRIGSIVTDSSLISWGTTTRIGSIVTSEIHAAVNVSGAAVPGLIDLKAVPDGATSAATSPVVTSVIPIDRLGIESS